RGRVDEAEQALHRAREAAPQSARPMVLAGQRALRQSRPTDALAAWDDLMAVQPQSFSLVAMDYARCADSQGQSGEALRKLDSLYQQMPSIDVLLAINTL